ncbi:MAG: hypothetical protein NC833_02650 [Candidatus Omnitrophica bacterium]|nr:hypothetical protein [Candidatus Omnitrophota bacterium]
MELSIWSNFYYDLPFEKALEKIKNTGFNYSDLSDSHAAYIFEKIELDKLIDIKEKICINIYQVHGPICSLYEDPKKEILERLVDFADRRKEIREREVNCIIKYIEWCKISGIECIVVHPGGIKGICFDTSHANVGKVNINEFIKTAKEKIYATHIKI